MEPIKVIYYQQYENDWVQCKIFSPGGKSLKEEFINLLWNWFNFYSKIYQHSIQKYSEMSHFYLLPSILLSPLFSRPSNYTYLLHIYPSRASLCKFRQIQSYRHPPFPATVKYFWMGQLYMLMRHVNVACH